ncbi:helix-turn-helix domain-containing protein [Streptomyces mirabilis]|uniref:helix-turn-helix domain-containing protein n=1 Tax=Streptomyces mirabilis TaxID=68239 RepID=UPI0037A94EA0
MLLSAGARTLARCKLAHRQSGGFPRRRGAVGCCQRFLATQGGERAVGRIAIEENAFGAELRRRRTAAGKSLSELAEEVHCSRSFLSRIETGQRRVTHELAQLCDERLEAKGALLALVPGPSTERISKTIGPGPGERAAKLVKSGAGRGGSGTARQRDEFDRLLRRGDLSHTAGDMREADRLYRAAYASAEGDPTARAEAVIRMARRWSDPGQVDHELLQLIRESLAALGDDGSVEAAGLRLRLNAHLAKKLSMAVSQDTAAGQAGPEQGARLARSTLRRLSVDGKDDEVACEVLTECRWGLYDFMSTAESLTLSERLRDAAARHGSAYFRGEALMAVALDQLRAGKVYSALATANQYRKHAADTRGVLTTWQQHTLDALLDLWHGRFDKAAGWILGDALTFVERLPADLAVPADNLHQTRLGQAYWLLREQGRMADLFASGLADTVERHGYFPVWRAGLALALCETGQYAEGADRLVGFAHDTADFSRFPPSGWAVPTLVLLAEVSAALDARGGFEAELRQVLPALRERLAAHDGEQIALAGWPTVLIGPTARARGLLALAAGEPDTALSHFRTATEPVRSSQPQLARLRLAQARALRRSDRPGAAAHASGLLREALRVARTYGMAALATECAALLDSTADA